MYACMYIICMSEYVVCMEVRKKFPARELGRTQASWTSCRRSKKSRKFSSVEAPLIFSKASTNLVIMRGSIEHQTSQQQQKEWNKQEHNWEKNGTEKVWRCMHTCMDLCTLYHLFSPFGETSATSTGSCCIVLVLIGGRVELHVPAAKLGNRSIALHQQGFRQIHFIFLYINEG